MIKRALWKVCRVNDVQTARLCAELGADYVGLHAIAELPREKEEQFRRIVITLKKEYPECRPVLLTKVADASVIRLWLAQTGIKLLQFHAAAETGFLRTIVEGSESTRLIGVIAAEGDGIEACATAERLSMLDDITESFLVDSSWRGGTGLPANVELVQRIVRILSAVGRVFLAGGLDANNVGKLLAETGASGADVQSGVEKSKGVKDPAKLRAFARALGRGQHRRLGNGRAAPLVSLALTDCSVPETELELRRAATTTVNSIHLDHSDGVLIPGFKFAALPLVEVARTVHPCMPVDIHMMLGKPEYINMDRLFALATDESALGTIFLHQLDPGHMEAWLAFILAQSREKDTDFGLSFDASTYSPSQVHEQLLMAWDHGVRRVTIVARSQRHDGLDLQLREGQLVHAVLETGLPWHSIGVDRQMNLERLKALALFSPNHVIAGKYLRSATDLEAAISDLRSILMKAV